MSRKTLFIVLVLAVLIAAAGIGWSMGLFGGSSDATSAKGYELVPTDRTQGNPKSPVVLIEYAAPSCPVCAAFNVQAFPQIKAKYIDSGKIFYVFRVFPLRPDDGEAEKIARCLPEDKYFSFIDLLFRNQPLWDVEFGVTDVHGGLVRLGRMAGLNADQVDKCIENKAEDDRINKVQTEAESRYSINSTPTFILNGNNIGSGALSFEQLSQSLDAELAKK